MTLVAIEDPTEPDEPEGMFPCGVCGQPTWYDTCQSCYEKEQEAKTK